MRAHVSVVAAIAVCIASAGWSAEPVELRALFPEEADVYLERGGLSRLVLPPEILARCRPDLSDLRLFGPEEQEMPYLIDRAPRDAGVTESRQTFAPKVLDARRNEQRRETGPPIRTQTFDLSLPSVSPESGTWTLVVEPSQTEYVARVRVAVVDAGNVTTLIEDSSLFRLRGVRDAAKDRLPLPAFTGERLRLTVETEHGFWLQPTFRLESTSHIERAGRIDYPLETLSVTREGQKTVVELARPRGIAPDALRVATATGTFDRQLVVWDGGPGSAGEAIGAGSVFRVQALVPVGELELDLQPANGDRLRVEIDDGDSPPLEKPEFIAVVRQPSLIFSLAGSDPNAPAGTLRFGGGRAHAPRYDLARLLPTQATGTRAEAATRLHQAPSVAAARLGAARPNPAFDRRPALAFAMRPGAGIVRGVFSHTRKLDVPETPEGLARLRLTPEDLAQANEDLSDVRVTDDVSRQWPYLIERDATTRVVPLVVEKPERRDRASHYRISLPVERMRIEQLQLQFEEPYFDRSFELRAQLKDDERSVVAQGRIRRPIGDPRPVRIDVTPAVARSLELIVVDEDDAALGLLSVGARLRLPELFVTAPAGSYSLLVGAPGQRPATYELERVRSVVLAVRAVDIETGPLEPNPNFSIRSRLWSGDTGQQVLLWVVLLIAVVLLVGTTLRLVRKQG